MVAKLLKCSDEALRVGCALAAQRFWLQSPSAKHVLIHEKNDGGTGSVRSVRSMREDSAPVAEPDDTEVVPPLKNAVS